MTEERIAEAQARLDALDESDGVPLLNRDAYFLTPEQWSFFSQSPVDLRDALAALRRVRAVQHYDPHNHCNEQEMDASPDGDYVRFDDLMAAIEDRGATASPQGDARKQPNGDEER